MPIVVSPGLRGYCALCAFSGSIEKGVESGLLNKCWDWRSCGEEKTKTSDSGNREKSLVRRSGCLSGKACSVSVNFILTFFLLSVMFELTLQAFLRMPFQPL